MEMIQGFDANRFWSKVTKKDGCWEWQSTRLPDGYGRFKYGGKMKRAHRLAWLLTYGELPQHMDVLHKCDNPPCCNPAHLFLGNDSANIKDAYNKGRRSAVGVKNARAILTEDNVLKIREDTRPRADIAREYGISVTCVSAVRNRKRWQHLDTNECRQPPTAHAASCPNAQPPGDINQQFDDYKNQRIDELRKDMRHD